MSALTAATYSTAIEPLTCGLCGVPFGLASSHLEQLKCTAERFYCPNGHAISYKTSEADRLRQQLAQEKHAREQETARLRDQVEAQRRRATVAKRQVAAQKGLVTKIRKRVGNGVCPCCRRTFGNLARHMRGQHPDWTPETEAES